MLVKFNDKTEKKYLEVEKLNNSVSFFIAEFAINTSLSIGMLKQLL